MAKKHLIIPLLCLLALGNVHGVEVPQTLNDASKLNLNRMGYGDMRWLGLKIYSAALWSIDPGFNGLDYQQTVMLSIEYNKNISRQKLLSITAKQWKKLGKTNTEQQSQWLEQLQSIWPDVKPGSMIASVVLPGEGTYFYDRSQLLGAIKDPDFGPDFLDIWLSPDCKLKSLRKKLLGITGKNQS